jgi:hypothetical protein
MALDSTPLICLSTTASGIFTLRKDIAKQHYNNAELNVPNNASLAIYQATLVGDSLMMGLKTDISPVDARPSKMEATIKNITTFVVIRVNQLMERDAAPTLTTNAVSIEKPKWTTMMAKNVRQVVNQVVETLTDAPKQEERKFNLRLTRFEVKEGETEKELV